MPADDPLTEAELRFRAVFNEYARAPDWKRGRTLFAKWCAEGRKNWTAQTGGAKVKPQPEKGKQWKKQP